MLDFPSSPSAGDKYPVTPVAGVPQYTWDGEKWTTIGAQISNAAPATALPLMDAAAAVVGVSTKYAREDHVHPVNPALANLNQVVRIDTTTATSDTEQTVGRRNIFAAPFDALAYNGMQVNGSMDVNQEGLASVNVSTGTSKHIRDGWKIASLGPQAITGASNTTTVPAGFQAALQVTAAGGASTIPGGNDYVCFVHAIEGYRVARLGFGTAAASSFSMGFWFYSSRAGFFSGSVMNQASDRSCTFTFQVHVANSWEYIRTTIPGDTQGTWVKDNGAGLVIRFTTLAGVSAVKAPGVWGAGAFYGATATINIHNTTTDTALITGLIVVPGTEPPAALRSPFIMRPYDQELLTCQRYYCKSYNTGVSPGSVDDTGRILFYQDSLPSSNHTQYNKIPFGVSMRASPTVTLYSPATGAIGKARDGMNSSDTNATVSNPGTTGFVWTATGSLATAINLAIHFSADARL